MFSSRDRSRLESEPAARPFAARSLDSIVLDLRQLALVALDSGQPMAAVMIAGTADRLDAASPPLPPRPGYP
jgi:hypothetical protein